MLSQTPSDFFTPGQVVPPEAIASEELPAEMGVAPGQTVDPNDIASEEPIAHPLTQIPAQELADDEQFDPVEYAKQHFDALGQDTALLKHLVEVDRVRANRPFSAARFAKGVGEGAVETVKNAPRMAQSLASTTVNLIPGGSEIISAAAGTSDDPEVATAMRREAQVSLGASLESQSQQTAADLGSAIQKFVVRPIAKKVQLSAEIARLAADKFDLPKVRTVANVLEMAAAGEDPAQWSDDRRVDEFLSKVALAQTIDESARGEGPIMADKLGVDMAELRQMGVEIDPAVVEDLGLITDVTEYIPAAKGFTAVVRGKALLSAPTKALAAQGVAKLRSAAAAATRKASKAAGAVGKIPPAVAGAAGAVVDGGTGAAGGFVLPKVAKLAESGLEASAQMVEGTRKVPGAGFVSDVANAAPVRGAVRGLAAPLSPELDNTIPLLAAAGQGTDEEMGRAVGSTAAFGALGGAAGGTVVAAKDVVRTGAEAVVAQRFAEIQREPVAEIEYGRDAALDAAHKAQMGALRANDPKAANSLNWLRATALPEGSELYILPKDVFSAQVAASLGAPAGTVYDTPGFIETRPDGSTRVLLNETTTALGHEVGHAVVAAMSPETRANFLKEVRQAYGDKQIEKFGEFYDAQLGRQAGAESQLMGGNTDRIVNEIAAEMLTKALYAEPLTGVPPTLGQKIIGGLARFVEATSLYTPQVGRNPEQTKLASALGVTPSVAASNTAMQFLRDAQNDPNWMAGPRPPVLPPEAPAPAPAPAGGISRREFLTGGLAGASRRRDATAAVAPAPAAATPTPAPAAPTPTTPAPAPAPAPTPATPAPAVPPVIPTEPPPLPSTPTPPPVIPEAAPATSAERLARLRQPAPTEQRPQNMRVTPEEQAALDTRKQVTGAADAERAVQANPATYDDTAKKAFADINAALQRPQGEVAPVRLAYRSVVPSQGGAANARTRKGEQDAAYARERDLALQGLPSDVRALFDKVTIPYRWNTVGDNVNVFAMSLDKVLTNLRTVARRAEAAGAADLVPYATTAGNMTPDAARQFAADLRTYTANQANGYAGSGAAVTVPAGYQGDIPQQNPNYRPKALDQRKADFINLLMGISPPLTNRVTADARARGSIPNVEAAKLAAANQRPVVQARTADPARNEYRVNPAVGVASPTPITETNPLRDEFARRGVDFTGRNLFQVTENLNLQDIQSVTPAPESGFRAPAKDLIQAGFMPKPGEEVGRTITGRSFMPKVESSARPPVEGNEDVRRVAREYAEKAGITAPDYEGYAAVNIDRAKRLADAYEAARHTPNSPEVQAAYRKLVDETRAQWDAIEAAGYRMLPWTQSGQPYANSTEMAADVRDNKRLYFFTTDGGFGTDPNGVPLEHPLLEPTGISLGGKDLVANDLFRAVHDFFGHAKEGYQFGPRGEYNAYLAHAAMFTPDAVRALATETLAQNSWVNYGRHLRDEEGRVPERGQPGYVPVTERPFADQKAFLLPVELVREATPSAAAWWNSDAPTPQPRATRPGSGMFMPEAPRLADDRTSGKAFKNFFSAVTSGEAKYRPNSPWKNLLPLDAQEAFLREYDMHTGNFDAHIGTSIPGYKDVQVRVGNAVASVYGQGGRVLDIGASEGSWAKTISALSGGRIQTVALDPNPAMANFFKSKSQVPGATYDTRAFREGFEDEGVVIQPFDSAQPFDVVHEAMVFQFISPERAAQLDEVKRLMTPGGVFFAEEKFKTSPEEWAANEDKKDREFKDLFYSRDQLAAKQAVVKFQQDPGETKAVGMVDNMVTPDEFEAQLAARFKHVAQYWDSGNFKGYAASDSAEALARMLAEIGDLNTDFSNTPTPRAVQGGRFMPSMAEYEARKNAEQSGPFVVRPTVRARSQVVDTRTGEVVGPKTGFSSAFQAGQEAKKRNETVRVMSLAEAAARRSSKRRGAATEDEPKTPTGWVLPNGEYIGVPVDARGIYANTGDFHGGVLVNQAEDFKKRFGLKEADRLEALKKGFVRVRYDGQSGRLGIEALTSALNDPKRRAVIESVIEQHAGKLSKITVNGFNERGKVTLSDEARVISGTPEEKVAAFRELLPARAGAFMPAAPVDSEAFKKWIAGSYFVNPDGTPMALYHGTDKGGFSVFSGERSRKGFDAEDTAFFTDAYNVARTYVRKSSTRPDEGVVVGFPEGRKLVANPELADEYGVRVVSENTDDFEGVALYIDGRREAGFPTIQSSRQKTPFSDEELRSQVAGYLDAWGRSEAPTNQSGIYEVFASIPPEEVLELDWKGQNWSQPPYSLEDNYGIDSTESAAEYGQANGYRAVVMRNVVDNGGGGDRSVPPATVVAVFRPGEDGVIKSADQNRGTYDKNNPDIRFMPRPGETIRAAAIRTRDGRVVEGVTHAAAYENAGGDEVLDEDGGFVTSTGRYVDRREASVIAQRAKQLSDSVDMTGWPAGKPFELDAASLRRPGSFMPRPESPARRTRADIDPATLPPGQAADLSSWVSTRIPWAKGNENDGFENDLIVGTEDVFGYTADAQSSLNESIKDIPGMGDLKGRFSDVVYQFRDRLIDNLLLLHDAMPGDFRTRAQLWYDGARVLAERFAKQYGVRTDQAAAVLATLSPQMDWYVNVHLADMVLEAVTRQQNTRLPEASVEWVRRKLSAIPTETERSIRKDWSEEKKAEKRANGVKAVQKLQKALENIEGLTLAETAPEFQPFWVRAYSERNGKLRTPTVTPEGTILPNVPAGSTRWQNYGVIAKAINSVTAPDRKRISQLVGKMHKVRNFYNNILLPTLPLDDVTIDTHAIAAALMLPYPSSAPAVGVGLGSGGQDASSGSQGLYGVYADAYRIAAARRGIMARQMQSITWEALRGIYLPRLRAKKAPVRVAIEKLFRDRAKSGGDIAESVRQAIDIAGGFRLPGWFTGVNGYTKLADWQAGRTDAAEVDNTEESEDDDE